MRSSKFQNEPTYPNSNVVANNHAPPTYQVNSGNVKIYSNINTNVIHTCFYLQKPISSVAPTSIHHTSIPSTVYQTSSIKVQPVEPQTITTTTKTPSSISHSSQVQSPQGPVLSPPQSSSTPMSTPEVSYIL